MVGPSLALTDWLASLVLAFSNIVVLVKVIFKKRKLVETDAIWCSLFKFLSNKKEKKNKLLEDVLFQCLLLNPLGG